ncbi:hypothetical protein GE300_19115 [Rhodobacteraceae bacterium 2CG4]|uniref:Uncharacterized protein n=1 Tax=Halovulum marinum TaxID=2662447 RepID=A0A6L5Z6L1_9RHOB|nr:hypothetical protein [Halovulum marinum]MSU91694.1 hypothetical protein [Halovulum marinum]
MIAPVRFLTKIQLHPTGGRPFLSAFCAASAGACVPADNSGARPRSRRARDAVPALEFNYHDITGEIFRQSQPRDHCDEAQHRRGLSATPPVGSGLFPRIRRIAPTPKPERPAPPRTACRGAGARCNKYTCSNTKTNRRDTLEASILHGLQHALMRDVYLDEFCAVYTVEINRLRVERSGDRERCEARLSKIDRELERLVDAIVAGAPAERLKDRMAALEAEQAEIRARIDTQPTKAAPLLHPSLGELYRIRITSLREVLDSDPSDAAEAIDLLRALITGW